MADLSDNTNWFEIDTSNSKPSPNGWPEGMMPSGVNDSARNDKGALKRFWDRINPVQAITPSGAAWTFATSNPTYPTAYVQGELYSFIATANAVGNDTFQVNTLGAKPVYRFTSEAPTGTPLIADDWVRGSRACLAYDSALNAGAGGFALLNPYVPISGDGAGGITVPGNLSVGGTLSTGGSASIGNVLTVAGNGVFQQAISVGGLPVSNSSGVLTVSAPLSTTGINYPGTEGHVIAFGWNGTNLIAHVDGTGTPGALATVAQLGGYLPLAGGSLSGGLTVGTSLQVNSSSGAAIYAPNGGIQVNGTVTFGGLSLVNNGGYVYSGSAIRSGSQLYTDGTLGAAGQATFAATGSAAVNVPNGGVTAQIFVGTGGAQCFYTNTGYLRCDTTGVLNAFYAPNAGGGSVFYSANGGMAAAFNVVSDRRLKSGIADSDIGLAEVLRLSPKAFRRTSTPDREEHGLIAQEVTAVLPHAVVAIEDDRLAIDYAPVTAALINAVIALADRITALEATRA